MRNYGDWNEVGAVAVAKPPSQKELDARARRAAEKEDSRLRLRERIKKAVAESQVAESRWQEISDVIAKLEARKEQLAAEHVAACVPIQRELALLRENQVNRILAGDDDDTFDESRRIELQDKISELNTKLETQIADVDASLTPLLREQLAAAKQIDLSLQSDLMNSASAENRILLMVARSRCDFLHRRLKSVRDAMAERPQDLLLPHVLDDSELMLAEANAMSKEAVRRCVSE